MNITPVKKVNAVEQVFEQMQGLLIDGTWAPGDKLPSENELCEIFNVSRITIRQAMQKLKALGLIETRTGSGSYVCEIDLGGSLQNLIPIMYIGGISQMQIFQFREMIESESVRLAIPLVSDDDLLMLGQLLDQMREAASANDTAVFARLDLQFHSAIVDLTENPLIIRTYEILRNVLEESMHSVIKIMRFAPALNYHSRILQAMEQKNTVLAESLMREHIQQNYPYFQET